MSFRRRLTAIGQWVAAGQQRDLASGFRNSRNEQRRRKKSIYFILMILSLGA
jgi:hypothetical protein